VKQGNGVGLAIKPVSFLSPIGEFFFFMMLHVGRLIREREVCSKDYNVEVYVLCYVVYVNWHFCPKTRCNLYEGFSCFFQHNMTYILFFEFSDINTLLNMIMEYVYNEYMNVVNKFVISRKIIGVYN